MARIVLLLLLSEHMGMCTRCAGVHVCVYTDTVIVIPCVYPRHIICICTPHPEVATDASGLGPASSALTP